MKYLKSMKDYLTDDFVKESVKINLFNSEDENVEIDNEEKQVED